MTVDAAIQAKSQKELARFASSSWEKFRGNFCPYIRPESQKDPPCLITCIGYVSWQIPMLRVSAWIFGLVHAGYSKALQLCLSVWSSAKSHSFIQLQSENTNGSGAQTKKPQHLYVVSLILAGFSDESPLLTLAERTKRKSFFRDVLLVPYFSPNTLVKVNPCTPVPMTW